MGCDYCQLQGAGAAPMVGGFHHLFENVGVKPTWVPIVFCDETKAISVHFTLLTLFFYNYYTNN